MLILLENLFLPAPLFQSNINLFCMNVLLFSFPSLFLIISSNLKQTLALLSYSIPFQCSSIRILICYLNLGVSLSLINNGILFYIQLMKYFLSYPEIYLDVIITIVLGIYFAFHPSVFPYQIINISPITSNSFLNSCLTDFIIMKDLISGISKAPDYPNSLIFCNK